MVDRVYQRNTSDSAPQPPTDPSIGYPTGGNPAQGVPATIPGPYWYHMITESLRRVVVEAGLTPDHEDLGLIVSALSKLSTRNTATIGTSGGDESDLTNVMQERISAAFIAVGKKVFVVFKCHVDHQATSANDFELDLVLIHTATNTVVTSASAVATAPSGGPYSAAAVLVTTFQHNSLIAGDSYKFSARLRKTTGNGPSYPRKMMIDGIQTR